MIREPAKSPKTHIISPEEESRLITSILGMKPKKGGSPPSENRTIKKTAFDFVPVIDLIWLKWKIW